ncbi:hypothetical protein M413DRAFT_24802 [Hebeloma cylindrosporum]|uniref:Uncharacterized protein n=1 Tax=Hebeloma cylindrosporum TaxID=76867 RepID=A0A0C3CNL0_HEBCY|nr:hypothetical protein M413DRAFT_24802 [Hebeloma cylindrosporum h7]
MKSPLCSALTRLSNSPAIPFNATRIAGFRSEPIADISLTVGGEKVGTFGHPNVEKILEKSKPSPFGKGDKTVMDLEYRDGREVEGKEIVIGSKAQRNDLYELIKPHISESLFVDRAVEIELYEGKTVEVDMHTVMRNDDDGVEEEDEEEDDKEDEDGDKKEREGKDEHSNTVGSEGQDNLEKPRKQTSLGFQIAEIADKDAECDDEDAEDDDDEDESEDAEDEDEDYDAYEGLPNGSGLTVLGSLKPLFPLSAADANRDADLEELVVMIKKLHTSKSTKRSCFP